jgi:predicted nicotinamide N-methyase
MALLLALLCTSALLDPLTAPLRTINVNQHSLSFHAPEDDAIMEATMAEAQAAALAAGADRYDEVMEEYCATNIGDNYWAQLWPSAMAIGQYILEEPALVEGRSVLELGCGLGLGSICAARAGATRAHATDIEENALRFASANAAANGVADAVSVGRLDWSAPRGDHEDCYDVVLAADVVYDETAPKLLAELLPKLVSAGGVLLLADNADRPYGEERRAELMRLCADAFAPMRPPRTSRIELDTRQGDAFEIVLCTLERCSDR